METTTIKLKKPIEIKKSDNTVDVISELVFRNESNGSDIEDLPCASERRTMGDFMAIAAKLCGKPVAVIKRLGKEDLERVLAHSGEVVAPGQATGDKV